MATYLNVEHTVDLTQAEAPSRTHVRPIQLLLRICRRLKA